MRRRSAALSGDGAAASAGLLAQCQLGDAGFAVEEYAASSAPDLIVLFLCDTTDAKRTREVRTILQEKPNASVVAVMPAGAANASLRRVLDAGVTGIVLDDKLERTLVPTAFATLAGQLVVPAALGRHIAPRPLSHRERQILALVMRGWTNPEIARTLYLAESTVKTHLSSAFRKLDARSRSEAVTRMIDLESGYGAAILGLVEDIQQLPAERTASMTPSGQSA